MGNKLLIFILQLPSWIVTALVGVLIYSYVTHKPLNLGPLQINTQAAGAMDNDELAKLTAKIDELTAKLDAISPARAAALPNTSVPMSSTTLPSAAIRALASAASARTASKPAAAPKIASAKTAKAKARISGGSVLSEAVRGELTHQISEGEQLSKNIVAYAHEHGGTLGGERPRFIHDSDQWLNRTYDLLESKVNGGVAMNFMTVEPSGTEIAGVSEDDAHLVKSLEARVATLHRLVGSAEARSSRAAEPSSGDEDNDI